MLRQGKSPHKHPHQCDFSRVSFALLSLVILPGLGALESERPGKLFAVRELPYHDLAEREINSSKVNMSLKLVEAPNFPGLTAVKAFKISFWTRDHKDQAHLSSGVLLLPSPIPRDPLPILSYHHATRFKAADAPSAQPFDPEVQVVATLFASSCCAVVIHDYLGLEKKDSPFPQFYLNAEIQARAAYDLIQASREFLALKEIMVSNDVLISGYSQGAHNALALQKFIEVRGDTGLKVLGSSVMSGPYSLTGLAREFLNSEEGAEKKSKVKIEPVFLALAILGMHEAHTGFPRFNEILKEPYATELPPILRRGRFREIAKLLPKDAKEIFKIGNILEIADSGPEHPFWQVLAQNDVDTFIPRAPVQFVHSPADNVVPFFQAQSSYEKMLEQEAPVTLVELDAKIWSDHVEAAYPAFMATLKFFNQLLPRAH